MSEFDCKPEPNQPVPEPPDLKTLFGDRYRICYDEAAENRNDPWMYEIPCRGRGLTIYPHGAGVLAVECDNHPEVANRLANWGLHLHQDGDSEKTFLFALERFNEVAAIVKPQRRRVLKDHERNRLIAAGTGHRFKSAG